MTDYYESIERVAHDLSENITGFGELLTASSTPIIDLKSVYGISELRDVVTETNTGTVSNNNGEYNLSTGATADSVARLESVEHGRYVAGFEAIPGIAVRVPTSPTGDQVARWGYFDENNGFGVGIDSSGMFTFIRSGGTERTHRRNEWRNDLNYLGFNVANTNIYRFPFRWYGSGPVRFYTTTTTRDPVFYFDKFEAEPGSLITEDPNHRIRVEVENNGTASDFQVYVAGRQFFVQGNYLPNRRVTSEFRLNQSIGTTFLPLVSFRQKSSFDSVSAKVAAVSLATSGANIIWQLRWNPSLTGASFNSPNNLSSSETALEWDNSATAITNGEKIGEGLAVTGQGSFAGANNVDVPDLEVPIGEPITLCARSFSGTATVTSVLKAREEW